jgi:hypothetical protein
MSAPCTVSGSHPQCLTALWLAPAPLHPTPYEAHGDFGDYLALTLSRISWRVEEKGRAMSLNRIFGPGGGCQARADRTGWAWSLVAPVKSVKLRVGILMAHY